MTLQALRIFTQERVADDSWWLSEGNLNYLKLMEELFKVSYDHDQALADRMSPYLLGKDDTWVITQTYFEQFHDLQVGQPLEVSTWIDSCHRFFVTRCYEIRQGDQVILQVTSQFAGINLKTRRMARLDVSAPELGDLLINDSPYEFSRLEMIDLDSAETSTFVIDETAIDANDHVNNLIYWQWYLEALPESWHDQHELQSIQIKYSRELLLGERVSVASQMEGLVTEQALINEDSGQVASQARIQWKHKSE